MSEWNVPADGQWHEVGSGQVLGLVAVDSETVQLWIGPGAEDAPPRRVMVFPTSQPQPPGTGYLGTASAAPHLWHVVEDLSPAAAPGPGDTET